MVVVGGMVVIGVVEVSVVVFELLQANVCCLLLVENLAE